MNEVTLLRHEYQTARRAVEHLANAGNCLFKAEVASKARQRAAQIAAAAVTNATHGLRECEAEGTRLRKQLVSRLCPSEFHAQRIARNQELVEHMRSELLVAIKRSRHAEYLRELEDAKYEHARNQVRIRNEGEQRCNKIAEILLGSGAGSDDVAVRRALIEVNEAKAEIEGLEHCLSQARQARQLLHNSLGFLHQVDKLYRRSNSAPFHSVEIWLVENDGDDHGPHRNNDIGSPTPTKRSNSLNGGGHGRELALRRAAARSYSDAMMLSPELPVVRREVAFRKSVICALKAVQQSHAWQKKHVDDLEVDLQAAEGYLARSQEWVLREQERLIEKL